MYWSMKSFLTRWLRPTQTPPAWIEPEELLVQMASTRAPLVIDVRGPEEFSGPLGHIENAVNTPLPECTGEAARAC
jgi:3-mercaptopyruvate sulfurtransferase SseA